MRIIDCKQQSPEWRQVRLGIPTASQFHRIITPAKLQLSEKRHDYRNQLLAEWLIGAPVESNYMSPAMERGLLLQPDARAWYAFTQGVDVQEVGFILRDDEKVGCSPDGLIGNYGGLEIKIPMPKQMVGYLLNKAIEDEHALQVQGSLWASHLDWWDALAWSPDIKPKLVRCLPDEKVFDALDQFMPTFLSELEMGKEYLRDLGCVPMLEAAVK